MIIGNSAIFIFLSDTATIEQTSEAIVVQEDNFLWKKIYKRLSNTIYLDTIDSEGSEKPKGILLQSLFFLLR